MEETRIVVTIRKWVQIGPEDWQMVPMSRVFSTSRSIQDMLNWAKNMGFKNPEISDLIFSGFTGESI